MHLTTLILTKTDVLSGVTTSISPKTNFVFAFFFIYFLLYDIDFRKNQYCVVYLNIDFLKTTVNIDNVNVGEKPMLKVKNN